MSFDKIVTLSIGENDSYGMPNDDSTINYTVPANHTLVCYKKSFSGGGLWATSASGDYQTMNGRWGAGSDHSEYMHLVSPYYYIYTFDGHYSEDEFTWSYDTCWFLTNRIITGNYKGTLLHEVTAHMEYNHVEAYALNAQTDIEDVQWTKNSLSTKNGQLPQFHWEEPETPNQYVAYLNDSKGTSVPLKLHMPILYDYQHHENAVKEVLQAGEVLSKDGFNGTVDIDVLLLNANGEPVDFWDSYQSQRNLVL